MSQLKDLYFQECEELLGEVERHLMALNEGSGDENTLHATFRAIHSIKGGAGAFGFQRLVEFAHEFEALLDRMRSGEIAPTPDRVAILLRAADALADLVNGMRAGTEPPAGRETDIKATLKAMAAGEPIPDLQPNAVETSVEPSPAAPAHIDSVTEPDPIPAVTPAVKRFRITFEPHSELYRRAHDPLLILRELANLGMLTVEIDQSAVPLLDQYELLAPYLRWTIEIETTSESAAIHEIFEFVGKDCNLDVVDLTTLEPTGPELPVAEATDNADVAIAAPVAADDMSSAADESANTSASAPIPAAALPSNEAAASPATPQVSSIRVDLDKLEKVVNLVGEIVISQAMLTEHLGSLPTDRFGGLIKGIEELSQHTRSLQDSVMAMRAQPVKSVFQRMPRLVREVSGATGKKVRLLLAGEETEIDKTVIEQLYDPLVHMIRNSVDHGVEKPEEREATGKPAEGTIRLSAGHAGGRIIIEISDDGKGINREKVLNKAIAKGLLPADISLTDNQIDDLIFLPGLSTADTVSNISGRGVGMDVVRSNIQRMGGRVSIKSTPGVGSVFTLALPLTLAVLDGMNVKVGDDIYVIPLANIIESLRPTEKDVRPLAGGGEVLLIRGEYVPLVYVGKLFGVAGAASDATTSLVVLVEAGPGEKIGLVLDEIVGQQQVVIKSLEANYQALPGISGATILGNGRVALILDVPGLHATVRGSAVPARQTKSLAA